MVPTFLGRKQCATARQACDTMLAIGGALGVVLAAALAAIPDVIAGAVVGGGSGGNSGVEEETARVLWVVAVLQIPGAFTYVLDGIYLGAHEFQYLAKAMAGASFVCRLWRLLFRSSNPHFVFHGVVAWRGFGTRCKVPGARCSSVHTP